MGVVDLKHQFALAAKRMLYSRRGEPYRIGDKTLRFVPGSRPVRLSYQASENGVNRYDALQLRWIVSNLSEGDFAVDVGANCGQCAIVMAERCGFTGHVVAFEPNPDARAVLERNFELNPSIRQATVEALACSDVTDGETELYENGNSGNSSLVQLAKSVDSVDAPKSFRVFTTTLDAYFSRCRLPQPRCVKIDTEGAEIRILKGVQGLLLSTTAILCELHPYAWSHFGSSQSQLQTILAETGRRMRYLDDEQEFSREAHYGIVSLERL